jgi:amino acid adenylation domain-containing protein
LEPSKQLLVAIFAVLKAGGAYIPIAPSTPKERFTFLVEDSDAHVLITTQEYASYRRQYRCRVVLLDDGITIGDRRWPEPIVNEAIAENLAYIIYTSGSTGTPRGVMIPHRGICNTLQWRQAKLSLQASDRVLLTLSFTFDASISQIFHPLMAGARLVIPEAELGGDPSRIIRAVRRHEITVLGATTSMWRLLLQEPEFDRCESVRIAFCGGESLPPDIPDQIRKRIGIDLYNMYGPTEASMEATCFVCTPGAPISIGRPISNMRTYVLDKRLQPAPVGIAGELYLGGIGLARGYLNDPGLTAERFQPDPFIGSGGSRMYRTGDICRWLPDGCLEYMGRCDQQVKLRGLRIELEEIQTVLQTSPAVRENVVLLREDRPGDAQLVGYVVLHDSSEIEAADLRSYLANRIPTYMIPSAFVFLESLPRTTSGKLDRRGLQAPQPVQPLESAQNRSERPLQTFLAGVWEEILGIRAVNDHDNFFELGGNSIQAAILTHKLEDILGEFVYPVALHDAPTIHKLSIYLRSNYPQSVARMFGPDAPGGTAVGRGSAVNRNSIALLRSLIRELPERTAVPVEPKNPPAVFVLSAPRSGSTLLRVMLGGHPALFAPPELQLLNFDSLGEREAVLSSPRDRFWLDGTVRALMAIQSCGPEEAIHVMKSCVFRDMSVKQFYKLMQDWLGETTLVDKTPMYSLSLRTLQRAEEDFENAHYIHLIRHPSPMISSFEEAKLHVFYPPFLTRHNFNVSQLAELIWNISNHNIDIFLSSIPRERKCLLSFEELVRKPAASMERIADFLSLSFHPNMIEPYRRDRRSQMTDALHPMARMLGDVKFHQHGMVRPEAAERRQGRYPDHALGEVTRQLARAHGYELRDQQHAVLISPETLGASPFFCIHAAGGDVSCYRHLARHLGAEQAVYAFGARLPSITEVVPGSVEELASFYVRELQGLRPHGPYRLGGWSFGGLVAFEMALQLSASGEKVALVALFDSYLAQAGIAFRPLRLSEFADAFAREHQMHSDATERKVSSRALWLRRALAQLKEADLVPQTLGPRDFRRILARNWRAYRGLVQIGRRYIPNARLDELVLFEAEDQSMNAYGSSFNWNTVASRVTRHVVPGNHYTILHEPNVRVLVDCLKQYLGACEPEKSVTPFSH